MNTTANMTAAALFDRYLAAGGTKSFKSFNNKAAIIAATEALLDQQAADDENDDPIDPDTVDQETLDLADEAETAELAAVEDAEEPTDVPNGDMLVIINEKLSKVQRAKLRKLTGGKLESGRWTSTPLPLSIVSKLGVRYKLV